MMTSSRMDFSLDDNFVSVSLRMSFFKRRGKGGDRWGSVERLPPRASSRAGCGGWGKQKIKTKMSLKQNGLEPKKATEGNRCVTEVLFILMFLHFCSR